MSNYRGLNGTRLEQFAHGLETSEELLDAIETVTGENFTLNGDPDYDEIVTPNTAYELWENGGRTDEILAALPVDSAEEGDEVFWGAEGKFAEFDGEKWIKDENF